MLIAIISICFCALAVSAVKMGQVVSIDFDTICPSVDFENGVIWYDKNRPMWYKFTYGETAVRDKKSISAEEMSEIKRTCTFSFLPLWRKSYITPISIVDGSTVNMIIKYRNGKTQKVFMYERYPSTFNAVREKAWEVFGQDPKYIYTKPPDILHDVTE